MPKYWGSLTDEDDALVDANMGAPVDFSSIDPEATEPVLVPPKAMRSNGTARQWYLTEGPGKNKGDKLSVPRAQNVKPVEEEWGGAPLKLPNQDVLEKGVRREGAIAREARKHLPGTPEYRGGAIGTRADQQVARMDEREAELTQPTSDQGLIDRLSTAIGGRANPLLARALEDPSEKRVKFPSLEELQGVARSLSGTPEKVPSTPGEFVDTAVDTAIGQTIPGRLYQAGKKFTAASGSLPKALYEYGETLFTPRAVEATKAIGDYGVELAREGIGKVRQGINADYATDIERQRAEAKRTGETAPYKLPDTHARTMRQAKMFDAGAKVVENVAEGINTAHQAGAGLAEALITPTNWALMNAPGAIVKAAKRGGEVSSITGLGETSVAQRWREGAAKAGAESNAALAEAKTLKDAATSSAVKQAGLETPEAVEGAWGGIRNLLTSDVNPGLVPGKGWWDGPMRTATTKRIKAEILNMAAKTSVNEPLMHRAVGAYFTYQMAKGLPQNFERITQGGEEFFRTGDQKKLQEILPDITSAAMLFMMAKHQLWQSRGNLGGERFRTKQGIAEYRQRTRMPAYDLTDAKIQKDFVREAFVGKRVVDHGDGLYGIRQGNSLDLARVKFVKPEDVKVEVDPATGEKKAHDAWITPPTAGAPPTIHLVAKTDMGLIKHEQTHLLTDMGALTGSLRDVERELGLEHGAIQDIPSIVKLRAELEARQKTAPPEAQKNILKQISRLDEAAKGIEAFPELVERTLGTSKTYEESIEAIYKIKNGPMPNILDVFEKAKKGDREAMAEIHDRGLGSLYTDTMILGSPEQVAKARRNQWFETAKFLLTGKKSAADVARDIAEGRFDLTGAKPPSPLYTAEEIARGKEPVVEAPPAPAPVDAVGRLREVATQNAALKKQFADMDKAKAPVADMKPVAQALDQSERDLHRAQADAVEAMKQHEKDAVAQKTDLGKRIAAIDQSTNVGKLEARELTEQADAIDKQLEELRGFMRKPASPEPPAPPPFPGSVEEKQAAAMDEAMAQETVPPPPMPERRSPTRKKFVDMPLEEVESEIRRLITDPERAESVFEVVRESRRDPLTGAKNLKAWELDAKRGENPVIVRSDHDKFKLINDNVSHAAGDQVLRDYVAAAHELGIDIYRIGGDEFRFLFKTPEDASRAMESLRDVIRRSEYDLDTPNGVARFGGVDISYGIGETDALADAAAQGQKESKPNRGPRFDQLKGKPVTSEAGDNQPGAAPAGGDAGRVYAEGRRYEDPRGVAGREASPGLGISPERFASREAQEPEQAEPYLRLKSVDILRKVVKTGRLSEGAHRPGMNEGEGRKFARNKMTDGMTGQQWLGYLRKRGVGEREIDFTQLRQFFNDREGNLEMAREDLGSARRYKSPHLAVRARERYRVGSPERKKPVLFSSSEVLSYLEGELRDRKSLKPKNIMDEPFDRLPGMESDPWVEGEGRSLTRRATVKEEAGRKVLVYDPLPMRSRFTDFFGKRRALPQALLTRAVLEDMDVVRLSVKEDSLSEFRTLPVTAPLHPSEVEYLVKMGAKVEPKPPLGMEVVITPEVREKVRTEGQYFFASRQAQGVEKETPVYYSKLRREIEAGQGKWRSGELLRALKAKGVKPEEMEWSRIEDLLKGKESVTKQEILDHLDTNGVKVEEKVLGGGVGIKWNQIDNEDGAVEGEATLANGTELHLKQQDNGKYLLTVRSEGSKPKQFWFDTYEKAHFYAERNIAGATEFSGETKYGEYALPGGDNYRELLLTLPPKPPETSSKRKPEEIRIRQRELDRRMDDGTITQAEEAEYRALHEEMVDFETSRERGYRNIFRSQHFSEPNVLAHVRLNERTGPNGERILHVEEIQSDWHQKGRKEGYQQKLTTIEDLSVEEFSRSNDGFAVWEVRNKLTGETVGSFREKATPEGKDAATRRALERVNAGDLGLQRGEGVPDAPFKKTWPELAFKRVLRWAADNGFDRVTWTTGTTQAERYDLSKQVSEVSARPTKNGKFYLEVDGKDGNPIYSGDLPATELPDYVGKELADKIVADNGGTYSGLDLKVGGEGMKGFYDAMLPTKVQDLVKKLDPSMKVGSSTIDVDGTPTEVHSVDLTPKAREVAKQGLPLFASRQAQTPEFKKWFGDSKVVDKDGKPLGTYHGTTLKKLNILDPKKAVETSGAVFFSSNPDVAGTFTTPREYGEPVYEDYNGRPIRPGDVVNTHLKIERPIQLTGGEAQRFIDDSALQAKLVREAKANGHDGIIAKDVLEGIGERFLSDVFVVFDKNQVKSVRNTGAWGQRSPTAKESARLKMTEEEALRRQGMGDIRFASRAAQLPPHLQAMADDLQRRRGIPGPRKRADLGEATKVTNALWDEFWEMNEVERRVNWRSHPEYRDEWDSPTLVAKDAKSAGTENLFVKGVGSGGSKVKLPSGEEVDVGPVVLNRQTGKIEFATFVNSKGKTEYVSNLRALLSGLGESKMKRLLDFRQFQHAIDLADAGIEHGTGYTQAEMQAFVDEVKKLEPDIVEKSEQLTAYYNSLLDYAVSKGAVATEVANGFTDAKGVYHKGLKEKWPHFSPMERLFEQETGGDGGGNKAGTGSPLRNIKGSKRPVVDEVWQAIDRTHRWISQVDRNMAAANLWRMQNAIEGTLGGIAEPAKKKYTPTTPAQGLTKEGEIVTRRAKAQGKTLSVDEANQLGALIEPRHDFDKSTSVVSVVVDGKVKELRVDGVVRDFLTALNRVPDAPSESKTVRALIALATYPTSFLKWMVTGMPAFQMAQLVRDPATGTMQTRGTGGLANRLFVQPFTGRLLPIAEIARDAGRAIGSALGKAPDIEEARFQAAYQRSAGMFSNMSAHDFETKESVFNEIQDAIRHGSKAGTAIHYLKPGQLKWGHFLDNWLDIIEKGKAPFESATRKAIARQTLKAGRNDLVAGTYARENTTNFATFGSAKWIRDANRFLPFLNAGLQSSRKFYLTMTGYDPISGKKNPKAAAEVWAKAFLWQTVPTMILWALNKGDDTIEEQRKGKNGLYYHYIRTPDIPELPEAIRGKVVAQPKAFTWATVFSTIPEAMLDALYQEKPEYLEENLIKPVRAMFNKDPHVYDAEKEVDYKPLGRVAKGIGNELKAGGLSPWINAYLGLKFNVDPFYGGKIEMEYQRNMDAPLRQGYRTGQLSKDLSQGMFNVAEKVDDTKAGEAFGTNVKGAVPGPDQIAFLANQVGLRDVYNLADRAYSEGTKREMPKGEYHPIQDLAGRRRFFPPDNRATGFASEAFADIAEKADTAVSSKKQLKKTDPLMLREYIQKRDTGFATAITKLKEQIDKLQKKRAQVSQMLTEDPAKRKQTLDELTRQIRGFQRRVIILTNEREKKREPE